MSALDPSQFAALFQEHARALWCIAAAVLGDRERARDVVQEAAIVGLERRSEFQVGTSFPAWMGQIVRYTALNEFRKGKLRKTSGSEPLAFVPGKTSGSGAESAERSGVGRAGTLSQTQAAFDDDTQRALEQLEETARACLLMRTVLDMSYDQIAQALAIPPGTAMSHVHRSRQRMRAALSGPESGARYRTNPEPAMERGARDI